MLVFDGAWLDQGFLAVVAAVLPDTASIDGSLRLADAGDRSRVHPVSEGAVGVRYFPLPLFAASLTGCSPRRM